MSLGAATYRDGGTAGDSTGTTATLTVGSPANARVGDLLLAIWSMAQSQLAAALSAMPSGWTALGSASQGSTIGSIAGVHRIGSTSESHNFTVSSAFRQSVALAAYSHLDPASLVATAQAETSSGTSHATPGGTVAKAGTVLITGISQRNNIPNLAWTAPPGFALRADAEYGGANATTSAAIADNLTPLPVGASYGGGVWSGGRTAETSVVTWTITALAAPSEAVGLSLL
jgi:hypothetical protein